MMVSVCLCNLKKVQKSRKDELRFLNWAVRKVKGFDGFGLKRRDLITVFKQKKGFYPGPVRVWGPHVQSVLREGSHGPGSDQETFLTSRATAHKQAREYISGESFTGGRMGEG